MRRLIGLCLVALACSFGSGEPDDDGHSKSKPPEPVAVVQVEPVGHGDVLDELVASASVEAVASADLMTEASGRVLSVHADVGDAVSRGTLLAVVENTSLDAGADRASDEVAHLEERFRELEALHASGALSDRELDDAAHALRTARTTLREARAKAGETRIVAPFEGVVAARDVRVGQYLPMGSRAFQVVDLSELRVIASLPERDLGRVALGQVAHLVSAYDAERTGTARVTRIAPVVDPVSGTFKVTLTLDQGQTELRPGQYVSVRVEVERRGGVLVVPKQAVLYEGGRPYVYVMVEAPPPEPAEDDGEPAPEGEAPPAEEGPRWVAERRDVTLGLTDERRAEVTGGLSEGEAVITVGHTTLREGSRVRVPTPEAAAAERDGEPVEDDG